MDLEEILVVIAVITGGLTGFFLVKFIQKKLKDKNESRQKLEV